jgi:hypothetical protein
VGSQPANEESLESTSNGREGLLSYIVENFPDHARRLTETSTKERERVKAFFESTQFEW